MSVFTIHSEIVAALRANHFHVPAALGAVFHRIKATAIPEPRAVEQINAIATTWTSAEQFQTPCRRYVRHFFLRCWPVANPTVDLAPFGRWTLHFKNLAELRRSAR